MPPNQIDVSGVTAKVERAYDHLQSLQEQTVQFVKRYPYGLVMKVDADGRRHSGILEIYRQPDHAAFGLLIGDCASNLRAALDHLVYAVARMALSASDLQRWETFLQFPICDSEDAWEHALQRHRLEGVSDAVRTEIKRRQPYLTDKTPDHAPLAALRWLNDRDKHRLLLTVAGYVQATELRFDPAVPAGSWFNTPPILHTESGAQVYAVELSQPIPEMKVQGNLTLRIQVREAPFSEDVRELLLQAGQLVQRIAFVVAKAAVAPPT